MPEWLSGTSTNVDASVATLTLRLVAAWGCGWIIAMIARRHRADGSS